MEHLTAYLCIQCTTSTGEVGDFICVNERIPVSPVFKDLSPLFDWLKANGWKEAPRDPAHPVGVYHWDGERGPKTAEQIVPLLIASGQQQVSVAELGKRVEALGYQLDRSMDCRSPSRFMTGPLAGVSYPCCTTDMREADTGLGFSHFEARRDANFRALQELRGTIFAVSRGAILEL